MLDVFDQLDQSKAQKNPSAPSVEVGDMFAHASAGDTGPVQLSENDVEFAPPKQPAPTGDIFDRLGVPAATPAPASLQGSPQDIANRALAQTGLPPAAPPSQPPQPKTIPNLDGVDLATMTAPLGAAKRGGPSSAYTSEPMLSYSPPAQAEEAVRGFGRIVSSGAVPPPATRGPAKTLPTDQQRRQSELGAAELIGGTMGATAPIVGPEALLTAPVRTAVDLGAGYLGSRAAKAVAQKEGFSPESTALAETVPYLIPYSGAVRNLADVRTGSIESPGVKGGAATAFGNRVGVVGGVTPEEYAGAIKAGPYEASVRIPRKGAPEAESSQPAIEPTTIKGESGAVDRPTAPIRPSTAEERPIVTPPGDLAESEKPLATPEQDARPPAGTQTVAQKKPARDTQQLTEDIRKNGIEALQGRPVSLVYDHNGKKASLSDADQQVISAAEAAGLNYIPVRVEHGSVAEGEGNLVSGYQGGGRLPHNLKPSEIGVATQPKTKETPPSAEPAAEPQQPRRMVLSPIASAAKNFAFSESGSGSPLLGAPEAVKKAGEVISNIDKAYDRVSDAALQKMHMGRAFPEVEQHDPQVAADLREMTAGPQYYRAKAESIVHKITQGMARDQEKGFVLLADKASRDWLRENRPEAYQKYAVDPSISKALADYKPHEEELRAKQKALGGPTIDEDYLRRVYSDHVAGAGQSDGAPDHTRVHANRIITPQMANKKGRNASPEYYVNNGLHEFGPSFATRYVATNMKLAEHEAAIHFLGKATAIDQGDGLPETVQYNGKTYFRPDVANQIKRATAGSPEGKDIAASLGVEQLPKPRDVHEYSLYDPTPADKSDYQAKKLAQKLQEAADNASGTKFTPEDMDELLRQAAAINHSSHPLYAGPKDIVKAFQAGGKHAIPGWIKATNEVLAPVSGMVRRQVIGLGFGVPHIKNILRRMIQSTPGAHLDPRGYARASKVLFSDELRRRGISGVDDPAFDALLRHAGISATGIESFRGYVDSNTDASKMERAWKVIKAAGDDSRQFHKQLLADIRAAHNEGGIKGNLKAGSTALAGAVETPFRPMLFIGHHNIFSAGGIDQRARLFLYDLIRSQEPNITDDQMAQRINDQLGRYARGSWTDLQQDLQGFQFFPGWNYSSVSWVLRHPFRTTVPLAVLVLIANQVINHAGKNKHRDSTDLSRVHVGKYSISDNLFRERLANAEAGTALRFAQSKLLHKSNEQALRDALSGTSSDARAFINMLNPIVSAPLEIGLNKDMATGRDIVPAGDKGHAGKPEKDWAWYVAHKALPAYSEVAQPRQGETPATFAAHNVGTTIYKQGKRKSRR